MADNILWETGRLRLHRLCSQRWYLSWLLKMYKTFQHRNSALNKALRRAQLRKAHLCLNHKVPEMKRTFKITYHVVSLKHPIKYL